MKTVPIVLDRDRNLGFNLAAARKFRDLTGKGLTAAIMRLDAAAADVFEADMLAQLLFVGLLHEDKELRQSEADDMVELVIERDGNTAQLINKVYEAVVASGLTHFKLQVKPRGKEVTS